MSAIEKRQRKMLKYIRQQNGYLEKLSKRQINIQLNGLLNDSRNKHMNSDVNMKRNEADVNLEDFEYRKADKKEEIEFLDKRLSHDKLFKNDLVIIFA